MSAFLYLNWCLLNGSRNKEQKIRENCFARSKEVNVLFALFVYLPCECVSTSLSKRIDDVILVFTNECGKQKIKGKSHLKIEPLITRRESIYSRCSEQ